jgi:protein-arginine kinase
MSDPKFRQEDVLMGGRVLICRQRTDLPFSIENIVHMETGFQTVARINASFASAMRKEAELAARHPFAWNPEFGYVTADPEMCGTGLRISATFHLEGLHLIGDLDPALNALNALRMSARGCSRDGLRNAAHIFRIANASSLGISERELVSRVGRVFADIVRQELNARIRLVDELPRVFEDAIARSLAVLRNCRLLSEWELMDIVSPLCLAANLDFLDNLSRDEAQKMMFAQAHTPQSSTPRTYEEQRERDRKDAALADRANRRFRGVRLNSFAKDCLS